MTATILGPVWIDPPGYWTTFAGKSGMKSRNEPNISWSCGAPGTLIP